MEFVTINIDIGPQGRKFNFRPGTCDEAVIEQIFKNGEYNINNIPRLPRGQEFVNYIIMNQKTFRKGPLSS